MSKKEQLITVQLIALYTILVEMINTDRIGVQESISILEKAGLTTDDYDTWRTEDKREVHFPLPFPIQESDTRFQRNNPEPFNLDPCQIGC